MLKEFIVSFFCLLIVLVLAAPVFSQEPGQGDAPPADMNAPEAPQQPVVPKQDVTIELKDNLLSVELINAEFGKALRSIAAKAGFKVEIKSDSSGKKLSTKFSDVDIESGITRLFTIVKEKNYLMHYDTKGAISLIEVGSSAVRRPVAGTRPQILSGPQVKRETSDERSLRRGRLRARSRPSTQLQQQTPQDSNQLQQQPPQDSQEFMPQAPVDEIREAPEEDVQ